MKIISEAEFLENPAAILEQIANDVEDIVIFRTSSIDSVVLLSAMNYDDKEHLWFASESND